jgi:multicomponent Na+:H+ antiporter subunit A
LAVLVAGLAASTLHNWFSSPMASAISAQPIAIHVSALPHVSLAFGLSLLTILIGAGILAVLGTARRLVDSSVTGIGWGPDHGFDQAVRGLIRASHRISLFLQPGKLEIYLTVTFAVIALALLVPLFQFGELPQWPVWPAKLRLYEAAFMLIAVIGLVAVLIARTRLTAVISLGIQGFAVAVLYLLFGAPDLSFTQFMVETLSVIILALIMTRLRLKLTDRRPLAEMIKDGVIAIACGLGFTLMLLKAVERPFNTELSDFFGQYSKLLAHGANVVNVIIVDFRGTDTLGEIAVVVITGLSILALIRLRAAVPSRTFNDPDSKEGRQA